VPRCFGPDLDESEPNGMVQRRGAETERNAEICDTCLDSAVTEHATRNTQHGLTVGLPALFNPIPESDDSVSEG